MNALRGVVRPIGAAIGWLLRPVGVGMMLFFSLPWIGRGLGWLWGSALTIAHLLFGLLEGLLWIIGFRPEKYLRVGVIILRDEMGVPLELPEKALEGIVNAAEILHSQARVRLLPAWPQENARFGAKGSFERSEAWIKTNPEHSPTRILDVNCKAPALREDLGLAGAEYSFLLNTLDTRGTVRRLAGWGAPLTIFIVRSIQGYWGCSNGPLNDYVTVVAGRVQCIAHELGHACSLPHAQEQDNLMQPRGCRGGQMHWWQVWLLRCSRHVSFF